MGPTGSSWCSLLGLRGSGGGFERLHLAGGGAGHRAAWIERGARAVHGGDLVVGDGDVVQGGLAGVGDLVGSVQEGAASLVNPGSDLVTVYVSCLLDDVGVRDEPVIGDGAGQGAVRHGEGVVLAEADTVAGDALLVVAGVARGQRH